MGWTDGGGMEARIEEGRAIRGSERVNHGRILGPRDIETISKEK